METQQAYLAKSLQPMAASLTVSTVAYIQYKNVNMHAVMFEKCI